jgi:hypothetical protein
MLLEHRVFAHSIRVLWIRNQQVRYNGGHR